MYDTLMTAGIVFTAGAGVGAGVARGDWITIVLCAVLTAVAVALLHLHRRADQASSHREGYITGKADGIITALHNQEASQ